MVPDIESKITRPRIPISTGNNKMHVHLYMYILVNQNFEKQLLKNKITTFFAQEIQIPNSYICTLQCLCGAPFAQRASYLALHSALFGPDGAVNYDYIVANIINSLLIDSRCIPNGAHTNHC